MCTNQRRTLCYLFPFRHNIPQFLGFCPSFTVHVGTALSGMCLLQEIASLWKVQRHQQSEGGGLPSLSQRTHERSEQETLSSNKVGGKPCLWEQTQWKKAPDHLPGASASQQDAKWLGQPVREIMSVPEPAQPLEAAAPIWHQQRPWSQTEHVEAFLFWFGLFSGGFFVEREKRRRDKHFFKNNSRNVQTTFYLSNLYTVAALLLLTKCPCLHKCKITC